MKKLFVFVLAFGVLPFIGCNTSSPGTGPSGTGKDTFKISGFGGLTAFTIKQGEEKNETVKIDRGSEFKSDVKFTAEDVPTGLHVTFDPPMVKASDKAQTVAKVKAADDAPLGEMKFKIVGTPEPKGGTPVPLEAKVKVEKK
jgi:hypothetical protein